MNLGGESDNGGSAIKSERSYLVVVWLGVATLAAVPIGTAVIRPDDARLILINFLVTLTVLFVAVEAYWWWVLILRPVAKPAPRPAEIVPPPSALRTWQGLADAMATETGDQPAIVEAQARGRRALAEFLFWQALCVVGVIGGGWMMALGVTEIGGLPIQILMPSAVLTPLVILVVRLVGPWSIFSAGLEAGIATTIAPLGLVPIEMPTIGARPAGAGDWRGAVDGATVLAGKRRGREVEIRIARGECSTTVRWPAPPFQIRSIDGKLTSDPGVPDAVAASLKALRKAKRWRKVEIKAGPEGIHATRRGTMTHNPWLYDLWLCERLAASLIGRPTQKDPK